MSSSLGTQPESSERTQRAAEADPDDDKEKLAQPNFDTVQFTFRMPFGENSLPEPDISSPVELSSDQDRLFVNSAADRRASGTHSSQSLSDSVQDFPEEFGRTYHAYRAGSYAFPNDLPERERLEWQGRILVELFGGKLYFAPLDKRRPPRHILDVATGTGEWAIQMGDLFPGSEIIATDLSPIQPLQVPPNVNFYVEDSVTGGCWWSFEKQVAQQAFDALEPGGYLESQEYDFFIGCDDGTMKPDGPLAQWSRDITLAGERCHRPTTTGQFLKEAFQRIGFVDVQEIVYKIPLNGWPKDDHLKKIGRMWETNMLSGIGGFSLSLFHRVFQKSAAETEVFLVDVRRELSDPSIHSWMPCFVVWGRKPHPSEISGQPIGEVAIGPGE
ncbi:hypothetical protein E4U36_001146 [Claviceps purpurea]|nr:hypothetical protein E4U36_001146 [Claviceps purpurea]